MSPAKCVPEDGPVVVIGAGYSGAMAALHLLGRSGPTGRRVVLIDRAAAFGRGLAYRHHDDNLLLNVPAGNMSALAGQASHFLDFCQAIDPAFNAGSFVSRRLYGDYLQQTLDEADRAAPQRLERVVGDAVSVQPAPDGSGFSVGLADGRRLPAWRVVLALGHFGPRNPLAASGIDAHAGPLTDPWDLPALDALPRDLPVMILGSGHTAVDVLFRLTHSHPGRPVLLVSRHGLLPQPHRFLPRPPPSAEFPAWLAAVPATVRGWMRGLRHEAARRAAEGEDWRDAMNELRPHTPALWQRLPPAERRRFLRHVLPYWDVHRHRLAPTAFRRLQGLLAAGQAQRVAGRVVSCEAVARSVRVRLRSRHGGSDSECLVGAIVNCTGPNTRLSDLDSPLVKQLLAQGLIRADRLQLGLDVDEQYRTVDACGKPVPGLYYLGPMLKALHWEAIAVPELRGHAQQLAAAVLDEAPEARRAEPRPGAVALPLRRPAFEGRPGW